MQVSKNRTHLNRQFFHLRFLHRTILLNQLTQRHSIDMLEYQISSVIFHKEVYQLHDIRTIHLFQNSSFVFKTLQSTLAHIYINVHRENEFFKYHYVLIYIVVRQVGRSLSTDTKLA